MIEIYELLNEQWGEELKRPPTPDLSSDGIAIRTTGLTYQIRGLQEFFRCMMEDIENFKGNQGEEDE